MVKIFGIYEAAKCSLIKPHLWKNLQKIQRATILPRIGTEASNFQVKFYSKVAFNIGTFDIVAVLSYVW